MVKITFKYGIMCNEIFDATMKIVSTNQNLIHLS
jgi:hypothetical protein